MDCSRLFTSSGYRKSGENACLHLSDWTSYLALVPIPSASPITPDSCSTWLRGRQPAQPPHRSISWFHFRVIEMATVKRSEPLIQEDANTLCAVKSAGLQPSILSCTLWTTNNSRSIVKPTGMQYWPDRPILRHSKTTYEKFWYIAFLY